MKHRPEPLRVRVERVLAREGAATARRIADALGERQVSVHGVLSQGMGEGWCHLARFDGASAVFMPGRADGRVVVERRTRTVRRQDAAAHELRRRGQHAPLTAAEPDAEPWSDYGQRVLRALDEVVSASDAARYGMRDVCAFIENQSRRERAA